MSAWTAEQIFTTFLTWKLPCEQFLNISFCNLTKGGGNWKRAQFSTHSQLNENKQNQKALFLLKKNFLLTCLFSIFMIRLNLLIVKIDYIQVEHIFEIVRENKTFAWVKKARERKREREREREGEREEREREREREGEITIDFKNFLNSNCFSDLKKTKILSSSQFKFWEMFGETVFYIRRSKTQKKKPVKKRSLVNIVGSQLKQRLSAHLLCSLGMVPLNPDEKTVRIPLR